LLEQKQGKVEGGINKRKSVGVDNLSNDSASTSPESDVAPFVSLVDIFFKAKDLEKKGYDVIHFDAGEPDFEPPQEVVDVTIRALRAGRGRYTEPGGIPEVRRAIADHINEKYSSGFTPKQTLMAVGGRMALYLAYCTLPANSRVGIISPDWPAYRDLSKYMGFSSVFFPTHLENSWEPDLEAIEDSGCNALVLNLPNNPTGKIFDGNTMDRLMKIAEDKQMTLIGDEVYSDYILNEGASFRSLLQTNGRCKYVFATSLSKSYSMTGFRAGYVVSDDDTIKKLEKINSLIMTSPPEFIQHALIAALQCKDYVREKVRLVRKRRDVAASALRKYLEAEFYLPDGALYFFPRLKPNNAKPGEKKFNSEKFALKLLEDQHVSVTPGTSFGRWYLDFVRITLLQSEERIVEGIERMGRLISDYSDT